MSFIIGGLSDYQQDGTSIERNEKISAGGDEVVTYWCSWETRHSHILPSS